MIKSELQSRKHIDFSLLMPPLYRKRKILEISQTFQMISKKEKIKMQNQTNSTTAIPET